MDVTQEVDADVDATDEETTARPAGSAAEVPGPPAAQRTDVRRRVMALRRW